MTTDKIARHAKSSDLTVDFSFYTSYICEDTAWPYGFFQPGETLQIIIYCGAEKDIIAESKTGIPFCAGDIHNAVKDCVLQNLFGPVIGQDLVIRMKFSNRFCNGASDEPQSDKTYGGGFHLNVYSFWNLIFWHAESW